MKARYYILGTLGTVLVAVLCFFIGRWTAPDPEPVVKYVQLPPITIKKDSSDLRPILVTKPDSIVYITVYRDKPDSIKPAPLEPPVRADIDTLASYRATVEDWNIERLYQETLIDSDTLGLATLEATVQYNRLTGYNYKYLPVQRQETTIVPGRRLGGYGQINFTNQYSSLAIGVKFDWLGVHAVGGYDYKGTSFIYGGGIMVFF